MKRKTEFTVPGAADGTAAADFLAARFTYHNRDGWCDLIAAGRVTVNGRPCEPATPLRSGDLLAYDPEDLAEPPVDWNIGIVSEDDDLLLVNKSGNLPCHPGGRYFNHTLWAWLKTERGLENFMLVNRLDRETSGLVLIAKHAAAAHNCRKQFSGRTVVKHYQALVEAEQFPAEIAADGWMTADPDSTIRKKRKFTGGAARPGTQDAERAETKFRLLKQCGGIALIEAEPHTGRLHQIRATLLALGTPVVGDKLYGADETLFLRFCKGELTDGDRARLRMDRQALHASGLAFRHPKFGRPVTFEADLPDDMARLLRP